MNTGFIYLVTNVLNKKVYVGKTLQKPRVRFVQHLSDAKRGRKRSLALAIAKYGDRNFSFDVLIEAPTEQLNELEIAYIAKYQSHLRKFGYNRTTGGDGCSGTEEVRYKMRLAKLGKKQSAKTRAIHADINARKKRILAERDAIIYKDKQEKKRLKSEQRRLRDEAVAVDRALNPIINTGLFPIGAVPWNKGISTPVEVREKQRNAKLGVTQSTAHIEARASSNRGKKRTADTKAAISASAMGRTNSDEHKQACQDAVKALWADPIYRERMLTSRRLKAEARKLLAA